MESILTKAKELERKYDWLQAINIYEETLNSSFCKNDVLEAAEFQEKIGFCFYRAAMQAKSNIEFKKLIKKSIIAYEKEAEILEKANEKEHRIKIAHAHASIAYVKSWCETEAKKRKELLDQWWILENEVLDAHESAGILTSIGKTCNDLSEYSSYNIFWLVSNFSELLKMYMEGIELAERAIMIFDKLNDKFELARAYWIASWYLSFSDHFWEDENKAISLLKKAQDYADKALTLSKEIDDAYLIGKCYYASWTLAQILHFEPKLAVKLGEIAIKYCNISKDNHLIGGVKSLTALSILHLSKTIEDPDKQKEMVIKAIEMAQQATNYFIVINEIAGLNLTYLTQSTSLLGLAEIETNNEKKQEILEKALQVSQEGLERTRDWKRIAYIFASLSEILPLLSEFKTESDEKRELLNEAKMYCKKSQKITEEFMPFLFSYNSFGYYQLAVILDKLATIETQNMKKTKLLAQAATSIKKSLELLQKKQKMLQSEWASGRFFGIYYDKLGGIIKKIIVQTNEKERITDAIEAYENALSYFRKAKMSTHIAESYWNIAQLQGQKGEHQVASQNYESASQAYKQAAKKIPQLEDFYNDYSSYMQAWNHIEQARYSHSIEEYNQAKEHYKKSAELHESTEHWSYLASNYFAWANMEEAEGFSRIEKTQQAKHAFEEAHEEFSIAKESMKQKLEEINSSDEKEMAQKLFKASNLRQNYCQARILMEDAKLLEREGKYLLSSNKYGEAAQIIAAIVEKIDIESELEELEYISILCRAWEKMANAEETSSAESYLEAAELFEKATAKCYTKKASFWALGNSYFCRGLAVQNQFQKTLDRSYHSKANKYVKQAANYYKQAGYQKASDYATATQRLFDAYLYMNSAEDEVNPNKKTKYYQLAEQLLQIAANAFSKTQQTDKITQVQNILTTVREEKALAISLNEVMQAPTIASSTASFASPTPTSEVSVGLENFEHANVQANLVTHVKEVRVGESFFLSVEFVNAGREPALLMRVDDFVPSSFVVVKNPEIYRMEETTLNMKGKQLAPLKLVEVKLTLQPSKKGEYRLNPKVHYLDELGQNKSLQLKTLEIRVEEVLLEDRVSTGTQELDSLLLGGIPSEYAVVLTGPPSDEREYLIRNFLEAGIEDYEIVFYISTEADGLEPLLEKPNFYLFLCNPKPKTKVPDLPNVFKLRSKTDLTNLSISLAKAYRNIEQSKKKRICVEIVSDVLVDYETKATRKWISELITDLGSKGFTMLCVLDPTMHPEDQANAVINLFDGEIELSQTEDPLECRKSIRVKKLRNQDYIKNPICLT